MTVLQFPSNTYLVLLENRTAATKHILVVKGTPGNIDDRVLELSEQYRCPRFQYSLLGTGVPSIKMSSRAFYTTEQADWYSCGQAGAPFREREVPFTKWVLSLMGYIDGETQEERTS